MFSAVLIPFNLQIGLFMPSYFLMTLTAHALFSRSFLAIRPLQQFSIFVAIWTTRGEKNRPFIWSRASSGWCTNKHVVVLSLTGLSLFHEVPFNSVAFVLGLNPCCCNGHR